MVHLRRTGLLLLNSFCRNRSFFSSFEHGNSTQTTVRMVSTSVGATKFDGKVAVVTASTDGIGFAIAKKLARDGARVMISSRKQANVDKALEKLKSENLDVSGMVCHVGKAEDRTKLFRTTAEHYGGIDMLVSNAAVNPQYGSIFETTEPVWDKLFDINVKCGFFLAKEAVSYMEKRGGGAIVFVSSIGGYNPFELIAPYSITKTAVIGMVKAMAPACSKINIRVNGIAPGVIETKFAGALVNDDAVRKEIESDILLGRIGQPDECAGAVSFLCSDDASYVTGETLVIAGGTRSRL
ncbi:dehydrogenase/reductase SDR family member 4-like [Ptychodera flava]|uniref:dehydrogenase/reductase SDR family member 4-like n=1 Tax=Ptychodera flava TaxID=63121 RepID=UPI003969F3E9